MNAEKVIERIRKIQNKTKNLGWGVAEYSPFMDLKVKRQTESQWVIVVGHNVYRKVHTLFLEVFKNGSYSLSETTSSRKVGDYLCDRVSADTLVNALCRSLKAWYPELNAVVSKEVV